MLKSQGYAQIIGPEGTMQECDTYTCHHCNAVKFVPTGNDRFGAHPVGTTDLGGFCRMCMKQICGPCADQGHCVPFEKKMETLEKRINMRLRSQRFLDNLGIK